MYKFVALDLYNQQGPVREAFLSYGLLDLLTLDFGRFVLGKGLDAEEAGTMSSKDATRIQRINAETNFGFRFRWSRRAASRRLPVVAMSVAGFLGDGNRNKDYAYMYFERGDLDSNSGLTALYTLSFAPVDPLDIRVSVQRGFSGSKVERLPHYFASKRNDHAVIISGRYQPVRQVAVFGEWVNYTWGITATSAAMLGHNTETVQKDGYYAGAEVSQRIGRVLFGGSFTQEKISRDDSLVRYLVETGMPHVSLGEYDRGRIARFFVDIAGVRIGAYRNMDSTPFPWLSGISPVSGERAMQSRGTSKWGLVARTQIEVF